METRIQYARKKIFCIADQFLCIFTSAGKCHLLPLIGPFFSKIETIQNTKILNKYDEDSVMPLTENLNVLHHTVNFETFF